MLKFQRNKLVTVYQDKPGVVHVHGVLADDIFDLEIDFAVQIDEMSIVSIQGKWNREETPECSRALPFLEAANGFNIASDTLAQQINKVVSRKACPHFANLLLECCLAAKEAIGVVQFTVAQKEQQDLTFADYRANAEAVEKIKPPIVTAGGSPQKEHVALSEPQRKPMRKSSRDFYIDLHTHSFPASQCSSAGVDELIVEAKRIGLDAICLTDHNIVWSPADVADLIQKHGFPVFRGNEITTDQGDMLVFGMQEDVKGIINLGDLKKMVDSAGGFMIAAHPFRGFLVFNTSQIGMTVEKAMQRPAFQQVHALEVLNGKVTKQENRFAEKVATGLGLPTTGGSDAHAVGDVGKYVTCFQRKIENDQELVAALQTGDFTPFRYRQHIMRGEQRVG